MLLKNTQKTADTDKEPGSSYFTEPFSVYRSNSSSGRRSLIGRSEDDDPARSQFVEELLAKYRLKYAGSLAASEPEERIVA